MRLGGRVRALIALVVVLSALAALTNARALGLTLQSPPTLAAFDSDGDGRNDGVHVTQVVHVSQGNITATLEGRLFPPSASPNASWSGWVDTTFDTHAIACASPDGCNETFRFDLRAPAGGATGNYTVVLNATTTPSITQTIVTGSAVAGVFPANIMIDDGDLLQYREGADPVEAEITYRSNTGSATVNGPKNRTSDGLTWSAEAEQATAGSPLRAIRMAFSPLAGDERIFVTQSDDGRLDAYVCTATCNVMNNLGQVWSSAPGRRRSGSTSRTRPSAARRCWSMACCRRTRPATWPTARTTGERGARNSNWMTRATRRTFSTA